MQLWLTLLVAGRDTITYAPPPLQDLLIGRDESVNDIILHDPQVSRLHARLIARAHGFTVQDLGSKTGTRLNDQPVEDRRLLMSGDVLGVGPFRLRAVIKPWVRRDEEDTEATMSGLPRLGAEAAPEAPHEASHRPATEAGEDTSEGL